MVRSFRDRRGHKGLRWLRGGAAAPARALRERGFNMPPEAANNPGTAHKGNEMGLQSGNVIFISRIPENYGHYARRRRGAVSRVSIKGR